MSTQQNPGRELSEQVCEALGINPDRIIRLVLDFSMNQPVIAYAEMIGDQRLLNVDWTRLEGAKIEWAPIVSTEPTKSRFDLAPSPEMMEKG